MSLRTDKIDDLNNRLATAWMIKSGIYSGKIPDLRGYSLKECIEASRIVSENPVKKQDGTTVHTSTVSEKSIPELLAWAISSNELDYIVQSRKK